MRVALLFAECLAAAMRGRVKRRGHANLAGWALAGLMLAGSLLVPCRVNGVDLFLDLGDRIPGESVDRAHAKEVDVLDWSWALAKPARAYPTDGTRAKFQNLSITKYVDRASPKLMALCAKSDHLDSIVFLVRRTGPTNSDYIRMTLKEVLVTGISMGGSGGEDRLTEKVDFNFAQLSLDYFPATISGTVTKGEFNWNIPENSSSLSGSVTNPPIAIPVRLASTLVYTNGTPVARLSWGSVAGASYQVWVANDLNSPFERFGGPMPSAGDGTTTLPLPADAIRKFVRVEVLSP